MGKEKILVIGACGQIGVELTLALRKVYGAEKVIAADLRDENEMLKGTGPYFSLDVMDKVKLDELVLSQGIDQVYLLAAMLSATGEKNPGLAWDLNMQSLLSVLDLAKDKKISRIFWPSSIAVFGPSSPKQNCPQQTVIEPVTVYGISKYAGECWCNYYHQRYGVDVRSIRYPGLISYKAAPGGGTTDYAIEIFHAAMATKKYECFLKEDTYLPMMYMPDAIKATITLMQAEATKLNTRFSYNLSGMSFSPSEIAGEIKKHIPGFSISYNPDYRQKIADSWPQSINDESARKDWGWQQEFDLGTMTKDMLANL